MTEVQEEILANRLECCPKLLRRPVCDVLDLRYQLPTRPRVGDNQQIVPVDVILHFRLERCSGPLVLGDLAHTVTLLPGEQVRLFTTDRHSRWSYDSESKLAYRHETTTEESYFTWSLARAMSDLTINQSGSSISNTEESWASGGASGGFNFFGLFQIGGGGGGGNYDSSSISSFAQSLSRHAESSASQVAAGVRAKSTTAIGQVEQRTHAEGESESHMEAATRVFRNPNHCHAITFLFYRVSKLQRIRFRLVAIERRVNDPAAPTEATPRIVPDTAGMVLVKPQTVLATSKSRLEVERAGRQSAIERQQAANLSAESISGLKFMVAAREPVSADARKAALAATDRDLAAANLLDLKTGKPSEKIVAELSWEREELIPTPGILVKGCLDDCNVCEPAVKMSIELDLERKKLENEMLKRQIELLDKAQEYRCCPAGEKPAEPADA